MSERRYTIRRAAETDSEIACAMMEALGYANLDRRDFERIFTEMLNHPFTLIFLAEDGNGSAVGLMTLSHRPQLRLTGRIVSIDELVVTEGARGIGVGGALLKQAKAFARSVGATRLELHTRRKRESYRRMFYIKNGFTEVDSAVMRVEKDFGDE